MVGHMDDDEALYGERLAASLKLESHSSVVARTIAGTRLAATRAIIADNHGRTDAVGPADGYLLIHRLSRNPDHDLFVGGQQIDTHAEPDQNLRLIDLSRGESYADMREGSDSVLLYLPRTALAEAGETLGGRVIDTLDVRGSRAIADRTMHHLGLALLPSLSGPDPANQLLVDQLSLMMSIHVAQTYGAADASRIFLRGGLAPWQLRRAKEFLVSNITGDVSLDDVAAQCDLSAGYFARAFRTTTGQTAHKWLTGRRISLAKHQLERTDAPLADIARDCGFADQSHFTRTFSKAVGYAPGAWRRARRA